MTEPRVSSMTTATQPEAEQKTPPIPGIANDHGDGFNVRQITSDDPDYDQALHLAVVGRAPRHSGRRHPAVVELLSDVAAGPLRIALVHGAFRNGGLVSAVLAVESPGGSALVLIPHDDFESDQLPGTGLALRALASAAWARSVYLLEVLLPPELIHLADILKNAGFRHLTNLLYLLRSSVSSPAIRARGTNLSGLTWATYSESTESSFCEAVRRSYMQSLDCPELTAIRTPQQAIASHRASGAHDPNLWFVAMRANDPVGVLLLSRMRRQRAVEIVYMGVAQPARGTGVADALMVRAVEAARSASATNMALAVDARNASARRFYGRWGFAEVGSRSAWIATPGDTDTWDPLRGSQH
jgi:GNAT superfamily N-acetyltransferase